MKYAIIVSKKDMAGMNISKNLDKVFFIEEESYECEKFPKADLYVFATRHQSKSGKPTLTCHSPGNWNDAKMGGKEKKLGIAPAFYLKKFYLALKKYDVNADITLECTHHGPLLEKPSIFVEIGSSEEQWNNEEYGKIITECIKKVFNKEGETESCILLGGGHYNKTANKVMEKSKFSVGHICPKYALEFLDKKMLLQAINKTIPKPSLFVLDWKGMGKEKERIISMLNNLNIKWKKSKEVYQL